MYITPKYPWIQNGRARQSYCEKNTQLVCGRSKGVPRKPQCVKECERDHCTSQPQHWSLLWSVEVCGIIFERGKMVIGEGPQVLEERMKTMDPDENEMGTEY